jgi:hypothetical protein
VIDDREGKCKEGRGDKGGHGEALDGRKRKCWESADGVVLILLRYRLQQRRCEHDGDRLQSATA